MARSPLRTSDRAARVRDLHLAVEHGEAGVAIRRHRDRELRSANRSVGRGRLHLYFASAFTAKEIGRALLQIQRRFRFRSSWGQNLCLGQFVDAQDTRVAQAHRGATIFARAQPIANREGLTDGRGNPRGGGPGHVHLVLFRQQCSAGVCGLRCCLVKGADCAEHRECEPPPPQTGLIARHQKSSYGKRPPKSRRIRSKEERSGNRR